MPWTEDSDPSSAWTKQYYPMPIMCNNTTVMCDATNILCNGHMNYTEGSNPSSSWSEDSDPSSQE